MGPAERDRRKKRRYRLDLPVRYRIVLFSQGQLRSRELNGRLYDISLDGMRLLTETVQSDGLHVFLPTAPTFEQCRLTMEIETVEGSIPLSGKVIWYDRTNEDPLFSFQLGIQFFEVTPEVSRKIQDLCRRCGT